MNPEEGNTIQEGGDNTAPAKIDFADTSGIEYSSDQYKGSGGDGSQFSPTKGLSEDNFVYDEIQPLKEENAIVEDARVREGRTGSSEPSTETDYQGDNQSLHKLSVWAKEKGYDIDFDQFDEKSFSPEHAQEVADYYHALNVLGKGDTHLKQIIQMGGNVDEYLQHRGHLQGLMQHDNKTLVQGQLYESVFNYEREMGSLRADENGNLSEASQKYLQGEVARRMKAYDETAINNQGEAIRAYLQEQIEGIPQQMQQNHQIQHQQTIEKYNNDIKVYNEGLFKEIDAAKGDIVDYSTQEEKDDFKQFIASQTALTDVEFENGEKGKVIPFQHRLQNDSNFYKDMLRLYFLKENGFFTDIKNNVRTAAYNQLELTPRFSGGRGKKRSGDGGGFQFRDTSRG